MVDVALSNYEYRCLRIEVNDAADEGAFPQFLRYRM